MTKNINKEPIDVIVLTFNRLEYFKTFVEELYKRTRYPFRLIAVDNGSSDGTQKYIDLLHKSGLVWKYVFTNNNLPMAQAFNEGLREVESSLFITTADDMCPCYRPNGPCWLEVFAAKMKSDKNIGSMNFVAARRNYQIFKNGKP